MHPGNSNRAYRTSERLGASARQTEARALLEAARKLDEAAGSDDREVYRAALRLNWRLWTIIQADVSSENSPLPQEIRHNILNLSVFIDRHTVGALAEPSDQKLRVLIDINRNIAGGLMTDPPAEAEREEVARPAPSASRDIVA